MKKTLILITLALCYQVATAQVKIYGKIKNAESGEVLSNAQIQLEVLVAEWEGPLPDQSSYRTTSDELGTFYFEVPNGSYQLSIQMIGFETLNEVLILNRDLHAVYQLKLNTIELNSASISALRAGRYVPTTASYLGKREIERLDQSKDFPFLLNGLPSTVISSDAGNGVGYTGIRIRGIDPTRVNVTINDIPLNDAEGQGVYWVDLPDLASSTNSIQIQRGVGTSSNGAASFGASVNVQTAGIQRKKFAEAQLAYGSFNTLRSSVSLGSGKMRNGWAFQGRFSYIGSDGFIDRAKSELRSSQFTAEKRWKKTTIKANVMLGHERTYQAWWGIPQPKFEGDEISLNVYRSDLGYSAAQLQNLDESDGSTYNYYTYKNEVDDYTQNHFQLFLTRDIKKGQFFKLAAHYTRGLGYFEQFVASDSLSHYELSPHINGGDTNYTAEVVRRLWLDNHFYGVVGSYHLANAQVDLTLGGSANQYLGRHFGEAIQTEYTDYEALNAIYYDNDAVKGDANLYAKALFTIGKLHPYADLQYRFVDYHFVGPDKDNHPTEQQVNYTFFNPKIGANLRVLSFLDLRAMYAIGNREPVRNDFISSSPDSRPQHESMQDMEFGVELNMNTYYVGITVYDMQYDNALVVNGQINDVGAYSRVNVKSSYRQGIEIEAVVRPHRVLNIGGNITFSENKIASYTEYVDDWVTGGQQAFTYDNTDLAFSPNVIAAGQIDLLLIQGLRLQIGSKYVGKQYLDNTASDERKLAAFQTVNASLQYSNQHVAQIERITVSLFLNNLTNQQYAPNGYTYSGMLPDRRSYNFVYPMAGFNWMLKLGIRL